MKLTLTLSIALPVLLIAGLLILSCASDHISNTGQIPATPTDLNGGAVSASIINLSWQDNSDNESGFDLYRRPEQLRVWTKIAELPENTTYYSDADLPDSTSYTYYVSAFNLSGSSPASATITISTLAIGSPPEAPYNQIPWNGEDTVALNTILSWESSDPDGDPITYDLNFSFHNPPPVADTGLTTASFNPGPLVADTIYYWQVTARDNHKHRSPSLIWSFRTVSQ